MKNTLIHLIIIMFPFISFSNERSINIEKSFIKWTGREITTSSHFGRLNLDSGNLSVTDNEIKGEVIVDMQSLLVEDLQGEWARKLEGHLKSDDFFSVEKHNKSSIQTTSSIRQADGSYAVNGVLTIKNISHPISFNVVVDGDQLKTNLTFDRSLYNVRFRSGSFFENLGDKLILDDIELEVTIHLN